MEIYWLGRAAYGPVLDVQQRLHQRVLRGGPEALVLCEHEPVITLGRSAQVHQVLADDQTLAREHIERVRTGRGGQVTYHGPGQLLAYPIVRLHQGVLRHVVALGEAVVEVAAGLRVAAAFHRDPVGVFCGPRKLAAIGVQVKRRVSLHGLALNVTPEASEVFRRALFVPCGEAGLQVTSLGEEQPGPGIEVAAVAVPMCRALCRAFGETAGTVVGISTVSLLSQLPSVE